MEYALIVGLGNPGHEYEWTRHNVGFLVLDSVAKEMGLKWTAAARHNAQVAKISRGNSIVILAKPQTFMNDSGTAVASLCHYYKIPTSNVIVVYDDIAFEVGDYRVHMREGTGGHNGVRDILSKIGGGFVRFRVGIGKKNNREMDLKDYVLSNFSLPERDILEQKMPEIFTYLKLLLDKGVEHVMNFANREKFL